FAHGIDFAGFPTIRYGAIGIASNTATVAIAFHSGTSDDFNPSVGVGNAPTGGNFIYLNWAYTDTAAGVATSDTVDSVAPGPGVAASGEPSSGGSAPDASIRPGPSTGATPTPSGDCAAGTVQLTVRPGEPPQRACLRVGAVLRIDAPASPRQPWQPFVTSDPQ